MAECEKSPPFSRPIFLSQNGHLRYSDCVKVRDAKALGKVGVIRVYIILGIALYYRPASVMVNALVSGGV